MEPVSYLEYLLRSDHCLKKEDTVAKIVLIFCVALTVSGCGTSAHTGRASPACGSDVDCLYRQVQDETPFQCQEPGSNSPCRAGNAAHRPARSAQEHPAGGFGGPGGFGGGEGGYGVGGAFGLGGMSGDLPGGLGTAYGRRSGRIALAEPEEQDGPRVSMLRLGSGSMGKFCNKTDVRAKVEGQAAAIRACHETQLQLKPDLQGKVTMQWIIDLSGRVKGVKAAQNSTGNSKLAKCLSKIIGKIHFLPPKDGMCILRWPLTFSLEKEVPITEEQGDLERNAEPARGPNNDTNAPNSIINSPETARQSARSEFRQSPTKKPRRKVGDACQSRCHCNKGLICWENRCAPKRTIGETCRAENGDVAECDPKPQGRIRISVGREEELRRKKAGSSENADCDHKLICADDFTWERPEHCDGFFKEVLSGHRKGPLPDECSAPKEAVCSKKKGLGQRCRNSADCSGKALCIHTGTNGDNRQRCSEGKKGQWCGEDDDCQGRLICVEAKCQ